jgi:hypothetical protein
MKRLLGLAVVLVWGCDSTPEAGGLAGTWSGTAVTSLVAQGDYYEKIGMQVTVDGGTATIAGICGGDGDAVGPGTVDATFTTLGTGVIAIWAGHTTCPARRIGTCTSTVFDYYYVTAAPGVATGEGTTNTISFSGRANSAGCGINDVLVKSFIGTAVVAAE